MEPVRFFKHPSTAGQKQYEALRAFYIDHVPATEVARKYGYTYAAFNSLRQKFKEGSLKFFMTPPKGPIGPRIEEKKVEEIVGYRRKGLSAFQIAEVLDNMNTPVSITSIQRILQQAGFPKLTRRTQLKIGLTKDNTVVPDYACELALNDLNGKVLDCAIGGIFLFAPMIEHFGLAAVIDKVGLPRSGQISALNYVFSMLALKLIGKERLSQISDFNFDKGLGLFAGLNVLPKSTAISTYSYRLSKDSVHQFMKEFVVKQNKYKTYGSDTINLDFHTIQHYGDESVLDEHWSGARGKRVKGAITLIAQDADSRCQVYVDADILKSEADDEILEFIKFWKKIRGNFRHTLVFDSKLTTYKNLFQMNKDGVKFITLRRRGVQLVQETEKIPADQWKRLTIDTVKRKYKNPQVYDSKVFLKGYGEIRQVIMRGNGREEPAFFITNDYKSSVSEIIMRYSKRWRVENSIKEAISFFCLNALSSPILIKIHFDVVLTMIADTLYYHLAQSLRGFENCNAEKMFRHFIDVPAKIEIQPDEITVRYPLRAHNPVLRSAKLDINTKPISWLGNRKIKFIWA